MIRPLYFVLLLAGSIRLSAQNNSPGSHKNVVITNGKIEYRFVTGNSENPVQIKMEKSQVFTCESYRTEVSVGEFYNNYETIDDVDIYVDKSKKHGIVPKYDYYNVNGIFYSDAHICYFSLPVSKVGGTSEVIFKKTILDPRYFTNIFFMENEEIRSQEIKVIVPSWMKVEIKEFNFMGYDIQKSVSQTSDGIVYNYIMKNLPAMKNERSAPGPTYYVPHILVLSKSAEVKGNNHVYFKTVKEQYDWYKSLVDQTGNDEKMIKEKTEELVNGLKTDEEKVKKIFQWVQDNIRYIAFENGIAGFRPEKAQEVLRKKYGDCKGMANLLMVMLHSINLDARRCWIGTKHIAYDYSTPSLSVDNHMICAWMRNGKPVYLDATEKYIGFGEIAERLQGKQTLIENGNSYLLETVPVTTHLQNTAVESRKFTVEGNSLKGHIVQYWKGENKVWLLSGLNNIKQDKQENALKQFLAEGKVNFEISNLKIDNLSNYNADLKIEYDVFWKDVLTVFDKETYLEIDNSDNLENFKIDTAKRKLPYWFDFKNNLVFETEIQLPSDKTISQLPEKLQIKQPGYSFSASYANPPGKIVYRNEIILNQTEIKTENFSQWNKDIQQLKNFYDQQLVLIQKK